MDKFKDKYRIPSARLKNWNYGWNAAYFITICTRNQECFFGEIINDEMELSEIGKIAKKHLLEIPQRYEYAKLGEFVIMPNHIHLIIEIDKVHDREDGKGGMNRDTMNRVSTETIHTGTNQNSGGITGCNNPMLHDNISRIFNWYTGRVTFGSRKINNNFAWQGRFYDHIIRDDSEYQRIEKYIINNPKDWGNDHYFYE